MKCFRPVVTKQSTNRTRITEKMQRDTLTPLDARNSLLKIDRTKSNDSTTFSFAKLNTNNESSDRASRRDSSPERFLGTSPGRSSSNLLQAPIQSRPLTPSTPMGVNSSRENLLSHTDSIDREPTIPNLGGFGGSRAYQGRYGPAGSFAYRAPGGY